MSRACRISDLHQVGWRGGGASQLRDHVMLVSVHAFVYNNTVDGVRNSN